MKVILAGMPKTGTKSLTKALTMLGYTVYDAEENFIHLNNEWTKIMTIGGAVEDFKKMYADVDATCDVPACYFWEEIHKAFPEAKVVLLKYLMNPHKSNVIKPYSSRTYFIFFKVKIFLKSLLTAPQLLKFVTFGDPLGAEQRV